MNAQKESFAFELDTFYRLERTKRPGASIALYAELLASMSIQKSPKVDCEVRFLSKTIKIGSHTVTETLNEFRGMGLIGFISTKGKRNRRVIELVSAGRLPGHRKWSLKFSKLFAPRLALYRNHRFRVSKERSYPASRNWPEREYAIHFETMMEHTFEVVFLSFSMRDPIRVLSSDGTAS